MMNKIIPAIIGGLLLSFLGRSCVNSDWYRIKIEKKDSDIEKLIFKKLNRQNHFTCFGKSYKKFGSLANMM